MVYWVGHPNIPPEMEIPSMERGIQMITCLILLQMPQKHMAETIPESINTLRPSRGLILIGTINILLTSRPGEMDHRDLARVSNLEILVRLALHGYLVKRVGLNSTCPI